MTNSRSLKRRGVVWLGAIVVSAACGQAHAQWFDEPAGPFTYNRPPPLYRDMQLLPPRAVVSRLEEAGYEEIGWPRFNGSEYVVEATGLTGARVRLLVDAYRGRVIQRSVLRPAQTDRRYGMAPRWPQEEGFRPGPDSDDAPAPRRYGARRSPEEMREDFGMGALRSAPEQRVAPEQRAVPEQRTVPEQSEVRAPRPRQPKPEAPARAAAPNQDFNEQRTVSRTSPDLVQPSPKVDGLNPDTAKPKASRSEDGSAKPAPSRQKATRTEPRSSEPAGAATGSQKTRALFPSEPAGGTAPKPASPAQTAGPDGKAAMTAEAARPERPAEPRSDKPVRVIQGVTPLNPDASGKTP